ncbi:hypothetical protein OG948_59640 (plasmid) [Embleya sp. NBC_00888]|uniref:hypothetical protein n=1 Tax=Embleya sp. NBC_00888 TaxID=2975960 RepID=UPI002F91267E|nr:hypothetical protein OG948_59640 [Embleya sp. NBC_00888]
MRQTLFRALVLERGWSRFATFDVKFGLARDALAGREREPDLHRVTVSERTFERWMAGGLSSLPRPDTCRILEHLFGNTADELFATAVSAGQGPGDATGPRSRPRAHAPASTGLDVAWTHADARRLVEGWSQGMLDRREFTAVWGAALWSATPRTRLRTPDTSPATRRSRRLDAEPLLDLVDDITARAHDLDERHGSAAAAFVGDQFATVARLARDTPHDLVVERRLHTSLGRLARTAGFMTHEQADEGTAQRWYLTGLRAAHSAHDADLTASILALMSNQATVCGRHRDALHLARRAEHVARDAAAPVRAMVAARACLAHAGAADLEGLCRAHDEALRHHHAPDDPTADRTELDALAGRALVMIAPKTPDPGPLLDRAQHLLDGRVRQSTGHERSALRHGAYKALAQLTTDDLDQAAHTTRQTLHHLPLVTSVQCGRLLDRLRRELHTHRRRSAEIRDVVDRFAQAAS